MAADEFDDDDRPARRPRNSRDDDDDRPARKRNRDDDYDDAPRRSGGGKPHHGVIVLVLGILGLCCGICGLVAFILGLIDLGKMKKGEMDDSGKGMTTAGMIIGIVTFVLGIITNIYFFKNPNMFK
jgi:Domain of unknown function (DUF4190)